MHKEIIDRQHALDQLFQHAQRLQQNASIDEVVKSGFVSYLCVRTYVFMESAVQTILNEYVRAVTTDLKTSNFVRDQLRSNRALRRSELLSLVGKFSEDWKNSLRDATKGKLGDSLDSIVNNRNKIAHGEDAYISLGDLQVYFGDACRIVKLVYDECDPARS